jgi:hypothetical protein
MPKKRKYDHKTEVRKLARERIGPVPSAKVIQPKAGRKKPKYKKPPVEEE